MALAGARARRGPVGRLTAGERVTALLISVGLAALSYGLFENPIRYSRWLAFRPRRGLLTGVAIIGVVIASAAVVLQIPRALDSGAVAESASAGAADGDADAVDYVPPRW